MRLKHPDEYLGYLIADVARLMRVQLGKRAKRIQLSRPQWLALAWLRRNEGISQAGLASLMEVSPMTLVRIVDKLEANGLVVRRLKAKDRRVHQLFLASRARKKLDELWGAAAETRREALAGIPRSELRVVAKALLRMRQNMTTNQSKPSAPPAGEVEGHVVSEWPGSSLTP